MAVPFTTDPQVVATRWRPLTSAEEEIAAVLLADAGRILLSRIPTIPARYTAGTLAIEDVERVQAAMVKRVLTNPEGVRSRTESIDDYTVTEVRDQVLSAGLLFASDAELAGLLPPTKRLRVGTTRLGCPWIYP